METGQVSGKVFRFLSTMHPSLSKKERARYGEFQPESWYPWTDEISAEFADLMKRSPRDPAFARGFAYVAQKGLPDGRYIAPSDLLSNLDRLPAAYRGDGGSGFVADVSGPREASVAFSGFPGMNNACIAVVGELTQRLQAAGASGIEVKHVSPCRLQGAEECRFEVTWASESAPSGQSPVDLDELLGGAAPPRTVVDVHEVAAPAKTAPVEAAPVAAKATAPRPKAQPAAPAATPAPKPRPSPAPRPAPEARPAETATNSAADGVAQAMAAAGQSQDLFEQLRARLLDAEAQSTRHAELEAEIERLNAEVAEAHEAAAAEVAAAQAETEAVSAELATLKFRIRELVGDA